MTRLVLKIFGWMTFFYCIIFIPAFTIEASRFVFGPDVVHIYNDVPKSIYANTPEFAVYGINKLDNYPDQIFILGASVPGHAFSPKKIMKEIPGYKAHNLCLAGSNMTEMKEMAGLIESRVDLSKLHSDVVVLNAHFVSFLENQREYNSNFTSIEDEELRHHLYKLSNGQIVPVLPEPLMTAAAVLIRPFIWLYKLKFSISDALENMQENLAILSQPDRPKGHAGDTAFFKNYRLMQFDNHGFTQDQFDELNDLIKRLTMLKATVVLVDLPVPSYFRKDFFIYDDYRKRISAITKNPAVHYLNLTSWAPDREFLDDVHARPEFYDDWPAELSRYLKTVIRPGSAKH